MSYASNRTRITSFQGPYTELLIFSQSCSELRADIKRRGPRFIFHDEILFCRSYEGLFLWCLDKEEPQQTMDEAHSDTCEHTNQCLNFNFASSGWATIDQQWWWTAQSIPKSVKRVNSMLIIRSINLNRLCIQL